MIKLLYIVDFLEERKIIVADKGPTNENNYTSYVIHFVVIVPNIVILLFLIARDRLLPLTIQPSRWSYGSALTQTLDQMT